MTWWVLGCVAGLLTLNWVLAVARFQVNVLAQDQWDFLNPLFRAEGWWALFSQQHGPHRQGLGFVLTSWVMGASGWDSRFESLWIASLLVLSAALALRLKWALTGVLRATDAWILLVVLALGQMETVIITPNASHSVFPLLLLLAAANLWLTPRIQWRFCGSAVLAFALLFTGFGLFAGLTLMMLLAGAALRSAAARRWRTSGWAFGGLAVAVAGLVCFAQDYTFEPASEGYRFPFEPWTDYGRFLVLMLAHPFGLQGATAGAYIVGALVGLVAIGLAAHVGRQWLWSRAEPLAGGVLVLLLGTALMFALSTAVGRVHLGIDGGMVSRYLTLLAPIPLASGYWAALQRGGWWRRPVLAGVWMVALSPLIALGHRSVAEWPGSIGLTERLYSALEVSAESKQIWVSTYLATNDRSAADRIAGAGVHPYPSASQLEEKLSWLRERRLSFFAQPENGRAYLPWLSFERARWLQAYPSEGAFRWMGRTAKLVVYSKQSGFVNIRVLGRQDALGAGSMLKLTHLGHDGIWRMSDGAPTMSLPVPEGLTAIAFESTAGAVRPASAADPAADSRELSFQLAPASLSREPLGTEWGLDAGTGSWRIIRGWLPISGLYSWEGNGTFVWTADPLVIEVTIADTPAYLNLHIVHRYPGVDTGPVVVSSAGRRAEVDLAPRQGGGFSLALSPADEPYRITIRNSGGARSPAESGLSRDQRPLALRLDRLTLDPEPVYPEFSLQ